jgi:hypothetical protein
MRALTELDDDSGAAAMSLSAQVDRMRRERSRIYIEASKPVQIATE